MKHFLIITMLCVVSVSTGIAQAPQPISHDGSRIQGATFSADSQRVLSWGGDTARVWDMSNGDLLLEISPKPEGIPPYPGGGLTSAQWNEDETTITVSYQHGSHSAFRSTWDVATGEQLTIDSICTGACGSGSNDTYWLTQATDATGERLASWGDDTCEDCEHVVTITEANGTTTDLALDTSGHPIKEAFWSTGGHYLAVTTVPDCSDNGDCQTAITIWNVMQNNPQYGAIITTASAPCIVWDIVWLPDENHFLVQSDGWWRKAFAGSMDTCAATWQRISMTGDVLWQYADPTWTRAYQMSLTDSAQHLIVVGFSNPTRDSAGQLTENRLLQLDVASGDVSQTQIINGFVPVAGRGDVYRFAYQVEDNAIVIWNAQTLQEITKLQINSPLRLEEADTLQLVPDITWATDYDIAFALTEGNQFYVWDTVSWDVLLLLDDATMTLREPVYESPTAFSDGTTHLSIYGRETDCDSNCAERAWLFDLAAQRMEFSIDELSGHHIGRIAAITDRQVAITSTCEGCNTTLELYDNQSEQRILIDEGNPRIQIAETGDEWFITRAFEDYAVPPPAVRHRLWDTETGEMLWEINTTAYRLSPSGETILIYGRDATTIHDFRTGEELARFPFEPGIRPVMAWSPDGRMIIFETGGGQLADVYDTTTGAWLFPNRRG